MEIRLTVPSELTGLTNGRRTGERTNDDGTTTTTWHVSYPINNYGVSLSIAPYVPIEERYHGIDGALDVPIIFWAIPEHEEEAREMWKQAPRILKVLGRRFGEYPFINDKYWVAETSYLGMEHQTIVAYGAAFHDNAWEFDELLLHETAHEWWGNKITVSDWSDFWIHEGFGTYAEAVYVNDTLGVDAYLDYMHRLQRRTRNKKPIIHGKNLTAASAYQGDIYVKGASVLHTLRYLLGDDMFFDLLHQFATDPRYAYQITSMDEWKALATEVTEQDLDWFWNQYIYRADLPRWTLDRTDDQATLSWSDPSFEMPLPITIDGQPRHLEMHNGAVTIKTAIDTVIEVDPDGWVLECSDVEKDA